MSARARLATHFTLGIALAVADAAIAQTEPPTAANAEETAQRMRNLGYLPVAEAAELAGVDEATVRRWVDDGDIEGQSVAGSLWIEEDSLAPKLVGRPKLPPKPTPEPPKVEAEPGGPKPPHSNSVAPKPAVPTKPTPTPSIGAPTKQTASTVTEKPAESKESQMPPDASWVEAQKDAPSASPKPLEGPIKGELIDPGIRNVVPLRDHVGARVGPQIIGRDWFLGITPAVGFHVGELKVGLQAPLNFLIHRGGTESLENGGLRDQDWDEASDFARVIRYIRFGRKEDPIFLSIDSISPSTIGHGQLMRFYQANIDVDRSMTGLSFDAYMDYGGFQLKANDVSFENRVLGALAFVKPLGFLEHSIPKSLSLGIEYVGDLRAPRCIRKSSDSDTCVRGSGHVAGPDPFTGRSRDDTFVRTDPEFGRPAVETTSIHALGFSGEMRVQSAERSNTKAYATFHQFLEHGNGAALGLMGRYTTGRETYTTFRLRGEYQNFSEGYTPSYFDTLYEVTKYQFLQSGSPHQITPTKYQAVFGDPENGFVEPAAERKHGIRLEAAMAFFDDEQTKRAAFGLGIEDSTGADDTSLYAHLELPIAPGIEGFGSFVAPNASDFGDLFSRGLDRSVILAGARVRLLPVLFAHVTYSHNFQIVRGAGHELHLGNERIVDNQGQPSRFFGSDRIFENVETLFIELEVGYEWSDSKPDSQDASKDDSEE